MRITGWSSFLVAIALLAAGPARVHAGGFELLPGGARSVARGGAVAARAENPMGLLHNPAGLAFHTSDQVMLDLDIALFDMCVDPYGYYGWGVYDDDPTSDFGDPLDTTDPEDPDQRPAFATTPLPKVCNSAPMFPIPQMGWVGKIGEDFAFGLGFVAPTVVTGANFGGHDGTINININGRDWGYPTPTRYALINQEVKLVYAPPTFGVGYKLMPELSVGLALTMLSLTAKGRAVQNATTGTQPSRDWLVEFEAEDLFMPTLTLAVHSKPVKGLDVMAAFRWVDDLDGSGRVTYETNTFHQNGTGSEAVPYKNDPLELENIRLELPWAATVGVRYAGLLPEQKKPSKVAPGDPMDTELWDVELDATYSLNERGSSSRVRPGEDVTIITRTANGGGDTQHVEEEDLSQISVDRHLKDSIAVRLGGSYSLVPRTIAVHAGVFGETRGVDPAYANVDGFAFGRIGFGLGVAARLGAFDLTAAYGHIFQETLRVAPPDDDNYKTVGGTFADDGQRVGGMVLEDPDAPSPEEADAVAKLEQSAVLTGGGALSVINAGEYTASFNIISVGMVYHF